MGETLWYREYRAGKLRLLGMVVWAALAIILFGKMMPADSNVLYSFYISGLAVAFTWFIVVNAKHSIRLSANDIALDGRVVKLADIDRIELRRVLSENVLVLIRTDGDRSGYPMDWVKENERARFVELLQVQVVANKSL